MKISLAVIASMAAFPSAMANFDIYLVRSAGTGGSSPGWAVYNGEPDCNQVGSSTQTPLHLI